MLLNILQTILQNAGEYIVDETLCTRLISPKDTCQKCIHACPLSCITITDTISIDDRCMNCGICSQACPTHAIKMKLQTLEYLVHEIDNNNQFSLSCKKHKGANETYFKYFCLGSLPDEYILYLLLKKPAVLDEFDTSKCEHCELSAGFENFKARKHEIEKHLSTLNLPSFLDKKETTEIPSKEYDEDKRAFLKSFFSIKEILDSAESDTQNSNPYFHKIYRNLLKEHSELYNTLGLNFPQKCGDCSYCEACVKLCPTKALSYKDGMISLNPSSCCNCGLCTKVCYDKALIMSHIDYEDFSKASIQII